MIWSLDTALPIIRDLQFKALQCGFHLALGGGVLNKGNSGNDLDIMVLPMDQATQRKDKFLESAAKYLGVASTTAKGEFVYSVPTRSIDFLFYPPRPKTESYIAPAVQ